jgi:hypothetical protein
MSPSRRRLLATTVVLAAVAGPDAVHAQDPPRPPAEPKTFRGETAQDRGVAVSVRADGAVTRVRVTWTGRCRREGFRYSTRTVARAPFDTASPDAVRDERVFREESRGGVVGTITTRLRASRAGTGARERWTGTFHARVTVRRGGRTVDTCRTATLRWSARVVTG